MESNIANGSVRVKDGNMVLQLLVLPWLRSSLMKDEVVKSFPLNCEPTSFSPKRNRESGSRNLSLPRCPCLSFHYSYSDGIFGASFGTWLLCLHWRIYASISC